MSVVKDSCVLAETAQASCTNKRTGNRSLWLSVSVAGGNLDMAAECELSVTLWEDSVCMCVSMCLYAEGGQSLHQLRLFLYVCVHA